jgi:hypothetical protein
MEVDVLTEVLPLGVEDCGHADLPSQVLRVTPEGLERLRRRLEQKVVDHARPVLRETVELVGEREDDSVKTTWK